MTTERVTQTADAVAKRFSKQILTRNEFRGEVTFEIPLDSLLEVCQGCRDEFGFDYLIDISSVDYLGDEPRFEMVYELYGLASQVHLRLKCKVSEDSLEVPSVVGIWATANWHEREVYDLMGIRFSNHPDLRRILMWEGYPFHPLRKDFPLEGKPSEMPDVAFTKVAPLEGGPFVTVPCKGTHREREPRSRAVSE